VSTVLLWVLLALLVVGVYLSWTAGRLDRLHARIDANRAALDAQLVRRASTTLELATSGRLDPATALLLAGAAGEARQAADGAREQAESNLTRALCAAFDTPAEVELVRAEPAGAALLDELTTAARRVELARRFHNDAVRAAEAVRRHRLVRYLRLAGRAPLPVSFEMDDMPPPALAHSVTPDQQPPQEPGPADAAAH
jgi:hypothetical protein